MIYLAELKGVLNPGGFEASNLEGKDFKVIEFLTESKSLYILNPILSKMGFPLINNLVMFRLRGFEIVIRKGEYHYYYVVDGDHKIMKKYSRDFKIKQII